MWHAAYWMKLTDLPVKRIRSEFSPPERLRPIRAYSDSQGYPALTQETHVRSRRLTNVIKHGYGLGKAPGPLWCGVEVSPFLIRFIIRHQSAGITQEQDAAQADARSARSREEG